MTEPQDDGDGVANQGEVETPPAQCDSKPPKKSRRRWLVVAAVVDLLLLAAVSVPAYRYVRDRYNPWITEANWKQIRSNMTLQEVEAIFSTGKPCALAEVKALIDKRNEPMRNFNAQIDKPLDLPPFVQQHMPPFPRPNPDISKVADDMGWQAKRQKVDSWYQWKKGGTRLFVGVNTENKVRLACLIRGEKGNTSFVHAVYPFPDREVVERTGKSVAATLPEEKLVEAYIRTQDADPASLEIASWGPHDLEGELLTVPGYQLSSERRRKPVAKVRVVFWTKNSEGDPQLKDRFYYIQNGEVFGSFDNPYGNQWIEVLRRVERQLRLRR